MSSLNSFFLVVLLLLVMAYTLDLSDTEAIYLDCGTGRDQILFAIRNWGTENKDPLQICRESHKMLK